MKIKLTAIALVAVILLSFCACAVRLDAPVSMSSDDEAVNMGFKPCKYESEIEVGSYTNLSVEIKLDYEFEVQWSSDNPEVAVVDSKGRVDALKVGKAVITASAKSVSYDYEIEVVKARKSPLSYSTAIIGNQEYEEVNRVEGSSKNPYAVMVNEHTCLVTVYTYDADGYYNKPVRVMACSTGNGGKTPNIEKNISKKEEWVKDEDKYYHFATYIGEDLMFRSAPYSKKSESSLVYEEYNKIGTQATKRNIMLSAADAKWIYDNCKEGTLVKIINSADLRYSPLGIPKTMKLVESSASLNWDPTDSTKGNPYIKIMPCFTGADDVTIEAEKGFDLYSGVKAYDTCGNEITSKITVDGDFDRNTEGRYVVSYFVTDDMNRTVRQDRTITVTASAVSPAK